MSSLTAPGFMLLWRRMNPLLNYGRRSVARAVLLLLSLWVATSTAQTSVANPQWTAPLTADGRPDLHGVWVNNRGTPLERPNELADRPLLQDAEVLQLQQRADRLFKNGASDHPSPDDAFRAAFNNVTEYKSVNATQSSFYDVDLVFDNRTALVIDPADGKIPPLTSE